LSTSRKKGLSIAGQRVPLGQTRSVALRFSETYLGSPVHVPVQVIRAKKSGPRVLLTGCVHGDELNGLGVIRELLYGDPPKLLNGTLVCVPVVNVYGMEHHTRYMPDRRDLNRAFPGSNSGSLTSRLAEAFFSEVVRQCDYSIDFHSAAVRRTNYPNVRADLRNADCRMLARNFGCELIIDSRGPQGSLRRAATAAGVPSIILEAGEVWKIEPGVVQVGLAGVYNVLKALGMVRGSPKVPRFQTKVRRTVWVRAERGGSLGFGASVGELVKTGQVLAANYNIFGRERSQILSPCDGIVLGMTTMPVVKPGDPVYHIAQLGRTTFQRVKKAIEESPSKYLFSRVHDDLATNIHALETFD